jgi:hypothetical protein
MNWMRGYIVLMVLILAAYLYAEYKRPPVINWTPSLSAREKIPYGTYFLYQGLDEFFGRTPAELRVPLYDQINNSEDSGEVYFLISPGIETSSADDAELLRYISRGNHVFMAAENLGKGLKDTLKLELSPFDFNLKEADSTRIQLVNVSLDEKRWYSMKKNTVDGFFRKFDTARATVLGVNSNKKVNYLRYQFGKGQLLLHAAPLAFSNYFALRSENSRYIESALSYLPQKPSAVLWDEYYKIGRGGATTPLRVILTKPSLKWAYLIALATILLYVFFQSKRRQRVISIVEKPRNATMDFVETVSAVYFNQGNHLQIGQQKLAYLLDDIRTRYGLQSQTLDEFFQQRLCHKTGCAPDKVQVLVSVMNKVKYAENLSAQELLQFSKLIDEFYK